MKVGNRDVWLKIGQWWICNSFLGREWIPPDGDSPGFWLRGTPRRLFVHTPYGQFMMAWTPADRWAAIASKEDILRGNYQLRWIEWTPRRETRFRR